MTYSYRPQGVCARGLSFEIEDNIVKNIEFMGGCSGNTQGVAALAEGMDANELIENIKLQIEPL